jgi:hypothetical protein
MYNLYTGAGFIVACVFGFIAFALSWASSIAAWGFLGFFFGWIPSLIIGAIVGFLWPLVALCIVFLGVAILGGSLGWWNG